MNAIFEINESILSLPDFRRSADPATAGGPAQPPAGSDSATPTGVAKLAVSLRGVVRSGRGQASEHLPTAPALPRFPATIPVDERNDSKTKNGFEVAFN